MFSPALSSYDQTSAKALFSQAGICNVPNTRDALNILLIFPELFDAEYIEFLPVDVGQEPVGLPHGVAIRSSAAVPHQVNTVTWQWAQNIHL